MDTLRIAELLQPFLRWELSDRQLTSISIYIDVLVKWNQRINLTAIREHDQIVTRHFGESLFAAQALFPKGCPIVPSQWRVGMSLETGLASNDSTVIDLGSGAGFPGLPLKIWTPGIRLTLIESNHKKSTFLKEVARTLALECVEVFSGRAEVFTTATADMVTLRAVERFENILPIATSLVKPSGRLALLIGGGQIDAARRIALQWQEPMDVPLSTARVLLVGRKV
jgi:16S rRNA (guanine527-N7)-methyltransferase